jgi:hypothetical protein
VIVPNHRRLDAQPLDLVEHSAKPVRDGLGAYKVLERMEAPSRRRIWQRQDQHKLLLVLEIVIVVEIVAEAITVEAFLLV